MNETENKQYINTLGELRKYKGKLIVCFYYLGKKQDKPYFKWMGKLLDINKQPYDKNDNVVKGKRLKMENMLAIDYEYGEERKQPYKIESTYCDAQSYITIPTKEELKTYMNFFRHIRIFGR